ncbi:ferric reductase NAD binding domain-containing protein [Podospora didyma]|uniref:Ferric reductase NAD binding domain-containing protein n=1 Tax=Podospora didyma TaxID=330526 RepID=A0AAE0NP76_9PEZI|nr:ferric reductase NAD binding domain-containing protein [Podospora didyma]
MGPPFRFLDLSEAEKHLRRLALDRYAAYAQLSALLPVGVVLAYRTAEWAVNMSSPKRGAYAGVPGSPALKSQRQSGLGVWRARLRKVQWWLSDDVILFGTIWGQRDQWIIGSFWGLWLLLLCILDTGYDYLHLTKRLGIIAASQYPVQYLLALKSINPFSYLIGASHGQVNRWHRVLARIINALLFLHVAFYLNYFVQMGILKKRLLNPVVLFGVIAFLGLGLLNSTALRSVRRHSYRLFFITHLFVAFAMPPLLFMHAPSARWFMAEALGVFIADLVDRKRDTIIVEATLVSVPNTSLVRITASIPETKIDRFGRQPGSYVILVIPPAARQLANPKSASNLLFELLYNPFTVAAIDREKGELTLVARKQSGPLTGALAALAQGASSSSSSKNSDEVKDGEVAITKTPLMIEGPYGATPKFSLGSFDRVLLVAGGIGATFTVPLYRSILHDNPSTKVEMVWAVRSADDATWAVTKKEAKSTLSDDNVQIFLTGSIRPEAAEGSTPKMTKKQKLVTGKPSASSTSDNDGADAIELSSLYKERQNQKDTTQHERPDLKRIVDDIFKHSQEDQVAVLVCGPPGMARELREHVGVWVMKGRYVLWHNEGFGF